MCFVGGEAGMPGSITTRRGGAHSQRQTELRGSFVSEGRRGGREKYTTGSDYGSFGVQGAWLLKNVRGRGERERVGVGRQAVSADQYLETKDSE